MPYISKELRKELEKPFPELDSPGELNYVITKLILYFFECREEAYGPNDYADYNEVIGVLECVKQELYRRLIAPYEDKKKEENGDVF